MVDEMFRLDPETDPRADTGCQPLTLSALLTWSSLQPFTVILLETVARRSMDLDPIRDCVASACLVLDITKGNCSVTEISNDSVLYL